MNAIRRVGMIPLHALLIIAAGPLVGAVLAIAMAVLPR